MVVLSWGFYNPIALTNNRGLRFSVNGFKYKGTVEVIYNDDSDLFDVRLGDGTMVENVYLDSLINVIDNLVEKTDNYKERIKQEYNIH